MQHPWGHFLVMGLAMALVPTTAQAVRSTYALPSPAPQNTSRARTYKDVGLKFLGCLLFEKGFINRTYVGGATPIFLEQIAARAREGGKPYFAVTRVDGQGQLGHGWLFNALQPVNGDVLNPNLQGCKNDCKDVSGWCGFNTHGDERVWAVYELKDSARIHNATGSLGNVGLDKEGPAAGTAQGAVPSPPSSPLPVASPSLASPVQPQNQSTTPNHQSATGSGQVEHVSPQHATTDTALTMPQKLGVALGSVAAAAVIAGVAFGVWRKWKKDRQQQQQKAKVATESQVAVVYAA